MTDHDPKVNRVAVGAGIMIADGKISSDGDEWSELFPDNPNYLKPWHPLMGFGWDAVRLAEAHHYCGIAELKARDSLINGRLKESS